MSGGGSNNVCWNGIVVEVLNRENYSNWSMLVKSYLVGEGLWDGVVEKSDKNSGSWKSRNGKALHAIQLSCENDSLAKIRDIETAEEAWKKLRASYSEKPKAQHPVKQTGNEDDESSEPRMVSKGLLNDVIARINIYPDRIFKRSFNGSTVLHAAVSTGQTERAIEFINLGKQRLLKMQDNQGYTALAIAAELTDKNISLVKYMVNKGGHELLNIRTKEKGEIPLLLAAAKGHAKITKYLFHATPSSTLQQANFLYLLLLRCIASEIFGVAVKILQRPVASPSSYARSAEYFQPICELAGMPSAFKSGNQFNLWNKFIYKILILKDPSKELSNDEGSETKANDDLEVGRIMTPKPSAVPCLHRFFKRVQRSVQTSIVQQFSGIKKIKRMKKNHKLVSVILELLCTRVSNRIISGDSFHDDFSVDDAMLHAAKNGIYEFIKVMKEVNNELLHVKDRNDRGIFSYAILNRQEKVLNLVKDSPVITSNVDVFENNMLHLAAEIGPSSYLARMSNAALQMQAEIQWFKCVKRIVPSSCEEDKNANDQLPHEIFTKTHAQLLKEAQQWAKETSSSFILVGTLIITIMFAAAFTVPGGFNSEKDPSQGLPIFLGKNLFNLFIIADAISLVTSSSSVLMFIGILTSHYAEEDFYRKLPLKLLFGLVTLFLSVISMMGAFCAALALLLRGYPQIVIAAMWLALLPILVFLPSLVSLCAHIFSSTLRSI